ncbi:MAG: hypothetical protein EOR60_20915 [Mesorhizobium sp.]|nr:MAG: hypothetical protein EOR60_20915 [Mesorhizobium sp.]
MAESRWGVCLALSGGTADLPPCGGDARQGREGCCPADISELSMKSLVIGGSGQRGVPSHPSLSCRTSPPQGGRLAASTLALTPPAGSAGRSLPGGDRGSRDMAP